MFNNSKEFLRSLVESKKEVSIFLNPIVNLVPNYSAEIKGRIVWFDDDAIGVEFVKEKEVVEDINRKKVVLYFKSAIDCIDPGWEEEK